MIVKELKKLIKDSDDYAKVLIPMNQEFDGTFYSPCQHDSGKVMMGTNPQLTEDDIKEMELLGKEIPEEETFLLIPCGFHEEKDHSHELN